MKTRNKYFFATLSGVLLALAYPPVPFSLFAFIALVPLLTALEFKPKRPYLLLYITFFVYHGGMNYWISSWQPDCDPYLLVSGLVVWLVHPFFFMFPFFIYRTIRKKFNAESAVWAFPFIWVFFEWLHSVGEFSYPWLTLGYTQTKNTLWIQFVDITGVWGASFLIVLVNILIFRIVMYFKNENISNAELRKIINNKKILINLGMILLIIVVPLLYGIIATKNFNHNKLAAENKTIKIGLIQPNINPWRKWETSAISQILLHQRIQDSLDDIHPDIDLYIWSETAITLLGLDINSSHNFSFLQENLDSTNSSLLTGFADIYFYKPGEKHLPTSKNHSMNPNLYYDSYNSAVLVHPQKYGLKPQVYHKMKLTPFGERIPYVEYYTIALKWLEWGVGISSWALGTEQKAMNIALNGGTAKVGSIICIESIYPSFVGNFVRLGADFLTVITNDAWYDHTIGPEQHYLISAMRAMETKRYIARCANTGVTGFIEPTGETLLRAQQYRCTAITASIPLLKNETIFVRFGDWLPVLCSAVSIIFFLYSLIGRKKNNL